MPKPTAIPVAPEFAPNPDRSLRFPTEVSRAKKWMLAGTAALSIAGCDTSVDTPEGSANAETATEAEAGVINQGLDYVHFRRLLIGDNPGLVEAKGQITTLSQGNARINDAANRAVDAATADEILDNTQLSSPAENGPKITDITDPALRGQVQTLTYVFEAGKLVRKVGTTSDFGLDEARAGLTSLMPAGSEAVRANAEVAMESEYAQDLASENAVSDANEAATRASLEEIQSPAVKADATRAVDGHDASEALTKYFINRATADQVRADLENITDPAIRAKALQALAKAEAANDRYLVYDTKTRLSLDAYDAGHKLYAAGNKFSEDQSQATTAAYAIQAAKYAAMDEIDLAIGEAVATYNNLSPADMASYVHISNPTGIVDLSGIKADKEVPNYSYSLNSDDKKDEAGPETYQQFGELVAKDGKLEIVFGENTGMTPEVRRHFEDAVESARPILEAAFASGDLVKVRYIISDDFEPSWYLPATREMGIVLSKAEEVTRDRLASPHMHEGMHALTRNLFVDVEVTDEELSQLNAACNDLRSTAYDDFEGTLLIKPELLQGLRDKAKPEHRPLLDLLIKAVDEGDLAGILEQSADQLKSAIPSPTFNQCLEVGTAGYDLLLETRDEADLMSVTIRDLEYLFDTEEYAEINAAWDQMLEYRSVFDKVIDESNYISADPRTKPYFGHSTQGADEMLASLVHAAISYKSQFTSSLKYLNAPADADKHEALLGALDFSLTYIGKYHPSLQAYLWELRDNYLSAQ